MMWWIIDAVISAFDIYIITSFYYRRLHKRAPVGIIFLVSAICTAGHYVMHYFEPPVPWGTLTSVLICVILTVPFRASWKQRLFYPFVITVLEIVAEVAAGLMFSGLCGLSVEEITSNPRSVEFLIGKVISKLLFFVFVRVLCRLHVMNDSTLPLRHWLIIMTVPGISAVVCFGLAFSVERVIITDPVAPFLILAGVLGVNTLAFIMYDELSAQSKALVEQERARSRMESDLRQYGDIITQSKEFASLLHDTRKHREAVHDFLAADEKEAALSYLEGLLTSKSPVYHENIIKSSAAVDMLLNRKIAEAKQNGIQVSCKFESESSLPLSDICLCLILGNALDNAIDACRKLLSEREKRIEIDFCYKDGRLTIRIANTSGPVEIINNTCATTKKNSMLHGYGLPNIQKAVTENGGNAVIRYEEGYFIISIMFLL